MLQRSFASLVVFASLAVAGAAFTGACSQQSEGEPCNLNADDCASNLSCVPTSNNGYRCCPSTGSPSTAVCSQNNTGVNGNNPPPSADASTTEGDGEAGSTSSDGGSPETSTSTEAGHDAAADSSGDAPSTGNDGGDASPLEASSGDAGDGAAD